MPRNSNSLNVCNQSCSTGCFSEVYVNNPLCKETNYYYMNRNKSIENYTITNQYLHMLNPSEDLTYANFQFKLQLIKKNYFVSDNSEPPNEGSISENFFIVYLKKLERSTNNRMNPIVTKGLNETFLLLSKCGLIKELTTKCHKSNEFSEYTHYIPFKIGTRQKFKDMQSFQQIKTEALPYIKKALWATFMITTVINLSKNMIITQFKKAGIIKEDKIAMFENILTKYITFINNNISILLNIVVTEFEKNRGLIEKCNDYFFNIISNPFAHQDITYKGADGKQKKHKFVIFEKLFENLPKNQVFNLSNNNRTNSTRERSNSTNTVVPAFNQSNMIPMNNGNSTLTDYDNEISVYKNSLDEIATELYNQILANPQFSSTIRSMIMLNLEPNALTIRERTKNNKSVVLQESFTPMLNYYKSMINGFKLNNSNNNYIKSLIFEKIKNNILQRYNHYNLLADVYDENIMILRALFPEVNNMITQRKRNLNNAKSVSSSIFSRFTSRTPKNDFYVKIAIKNAEIYVLYNTIGKNQKNVVYEQPLNISFVQNVQSNPLHQKIHSFVLNNIVLEPNVQSNTQLNNDFVTKYNQEIDKIVENIENIIMYKYGTYFESLNISSIKNITENSVVAVKNTNTLLKMLKKQRNNTKNINLTSTNVQIPNVQPVQNVQPESVFNRLKKKWW